MNKIRSSQWLYVGLLFMLTACQAAGGSSRAAPFRPGDTIDGMSLTTGSADALPLWAFCSAAQPNGNTLISDCDVPVLPRLAIGHVFMLADEKINDLDWSELTWELSIDDQPVDLEAFGTFEHVMPMMPEKPSPIREVFVRFTAWDVVLTNLSPGEHTLHGLAQTETDSYTWVINLTIESNSPDEGIRRDPVKLVAASGIN